MYFVEELRRIKRSNREAFEQIVFGVTIALLNLLQVAVLIVYFALQ